MANGETINEVIDRIEGHILRIEEKIDEIHREGCHQARGYMERIENLEKWRDRGIVGAFGLAASIAAKWLKG